MSSGRQHDHRRPIFASAGIGCRVEVEASYPDGPALRRAVELLRKATVLSLPGLDHGAFWAAPEPVAEQLR